MLYHYLEMDDDGKFVNVPRTDNQLHEYIDLAYGVRLPRKIITPGHRTSFDLVSDLFFERVGMALGFGNRNGGKTFTLGILNHLDMTFKDNVEIASAGAVKEQANKCYRYFQEFNNAPWFQHVNDQYLVRTGRPFFVPKDSTQKKTQFGNGALLEIITGTETGFRGPHPHKARIDEIDELEWDVFQTGMSMSRSTDTIRGQDVFTSTRQKAHGTMQRLIDEAKERGVTIYEWNVWEMVEKCTRRCHNDPEHGDCPAYKFCKGKAHQCDGFYKIDDFVKKNTAMDTDRWETEWENKKPAREKMVYHRFSPTRHVLSREDFFRMTGRHEPSWEWPMISAIDFGSSPGHPFVYSKYVQLPGGAWVVWWEYVAEQRLLRDHARSIMACPLYSPSELCFADWDAQDRLELAKLGIRTRRAVKGAGSVGVGIDYISGLLAGFPPREEPRLYFMDNCRHHIREYGIYQWPTHADGKADKSGRPLQVNDHTCDCDRYGLYSYHKMGNMRYETCSIAGL